MANMGSVLTNALNDCDDGDFSSSSEIDYPDLLEKFNGNPLEVDYPIMTQVYFVITLCLVWILHRMVVILRQGESLLALPPPSELIQIWALL